MSGMRERGKEEDEISATNDDERERRKESKPQHEVTRTRR
jgi:hypothetical protein